MKIAHLSDIHFTTFFRNFNLYKFENLLQYCNSRRIDHLIITGDLVENPDEYDFELLRKVLKQNGFLTSDRLSLVIGNHDIFGGVVTVEDLFNFTNHCEGIDYGQRVREFYDYFSESFKHCSYISPVNIFPYAKIIDDILIVGLNSVAEYSKAKNIFASKGEINPAQLNEVTGIFNMFSKYKTKLVLIHHHFGESKQIQQNRFGSVWQIIEKQTMKLRTKKQLLELFDKFKVDLVLHGHYHEMSEYYRKGIRFLNAGGSFKNELKEQNLVNFLDLSLPKLKVDVARIPHLLSPKILSFGKLNSVTF
jgi:3',5'-cyclic-AMP phosphodiesterase